MLSEARTVARGFAGIPQQLEELTAKAQSREQELARVQSDLQQASRLNLELESEKAAHDHCGRCRRDRVRPGGHGFSAVGGTWTRQPIPLRSRLKIGHAVHLVVAPQKYLARVFVRSLRQRTRSPI